MKRQEGPAKDVIDIAGKAQKSLCKRFIAFVMRDKHSNTTAVAIARELAGFVWALVRQVADGGGRGQGRYQKKDDTKMNEEAIHHSRQGARPASGEPTRNPLYTSLFILAIGQITFPVGA